MKNVYPELFVPNDKDMVVHQGEVRNPQLKACFDTLGATHQGTKVGLYPCHGHHGTQEFVLTSRKEIRVASMDYDTYVGLFRICFRTSLKSSRFLTHDS